MKHTYPNYRNILTSIAKHSRYRNECINLIASENVMSPSTMMALSTDLGNRYTVGYPGKRWYAGCRFYDQIETSASALARKLFHAKYVNLQPISGMVANMVAFHALLKPNDVLMSLEIKHSGHYSHVKTGMFSLFRVRVEPLPFDSKNYTIDLEKAVKCIKTMRPKVIDTDLYTLPFRAGWKKPDRLPVGIQ
ncbi:hypothetical protein HY086_00960 [Candidatus Gottesmanbacteria bacterium]|nr:hypothetical protein [Candidatus Gottesmanbacteria bacterium]